MLNYHNSTERDEVNTDAGPTNKAPAMEMQQMDKSDPFADNQAYGAPAHDPHAILNECRDVQRAIDDLEAQLSQLQRAQRGFVSGTGASNRDIDAMSAEIMGGYRSMGDRVKRIKSKPGTSPVIHHPTNFSNISAEARNATNAPQVNALDRRLKKAINAFQQQESSFRHEVSEQQKRQYLIVNPSATADELRSVSEAGGDVQIFQQALLSSDRRGQAQSTLANVRQRHDAIQQIEKTMLELAQLFQDLDRMVVEQEPMVQHAEKQADETRVHMEAANVELGGAVDKARSARRKKWICLGILLAIIVVIIVVVLVWGATTQGWFNKNNNNNSKPAA